MRATAAYGLHITAPGADGNPAPVATGRPDAAFMDGQWGPGGNAGTVWKIDGRTGKVSVFAVLKAEGIDNGGAGLGNIVFDPSHYQLFVSDLDSGLIFRLDMNGNVLGTFDHGRNGRPAEGLDPVEDDGSRADITSPDFSTDNSDTWGLTDMRRRVWGLGFYRNRLYYAVGEGPQIWSVGFNDDGSFAGDAQVEISRVAVPHARHEYGAALYPRPGRQVDAGPRGIRHRFPARPPERLRRRGPVLRGRPVEHRRRPAGRSRLRRIREDHRPWPAGQRPAARAATQRAALGLVVRGL